MDWTWFDLSIRRANNVLSRERKATMAILHAKRKTSTPRLALEFSWDGGEGNGVWCPWNSGFCRMGFRPPTGSIRPEEGLPGRQVLETEPLTTGGGAGPS
jgi:hypothetical protein